MLQEHLQKVFGNQDLFGLIFDYLEQADGRGGKYFQHYAILSQVSKQFHKSCQGLDKYYKSQLEKIITSLGIKISNLTEFLSDLDARLRSARISYTTYLQALLWYNTRTLLLQEDPNWNNADIALKSLSLKLGNDPLLSFLLAANAREQDQDYAVVLNLLRNCEGIINAKFLKITYCNKLTDRDKDLLVDIICSEYSALLSKVDKQCVLDRPYWFKAFYLNYYNAEKLLQLAAINDFHSHIKGVNKRTILELSLVNDPERIFYLLTFDDIANFWDCHLSDRDRNKYQCSTLLTYFSRLSHGNQEDFLKIFNILEIHSNKLIDITLNATLDIFTQNCQSIFIRNVSKFTLMDREKFERLLEFNLLSYILKLIAKVDDPENFFSSLPFFNQPRSVLFKHNPQLIFIMSDLFKDSAYFDYTINEMLKWFPEIKTINSEQEANSLWTVIDPIIKSEYQHQLFIALENHKISIDDLKKCSQIKWQGKTLLHHFVFLENVPNILNLITKENNLLMVLKQKYLESKPYYSRAFNYMFSFFCHAENSNPDEVDSYEDYKKKLAFIENKRKGLMAELDTLDKEDQKLCEKFFLYHDEDVTKYKKIA